MIEEESSLLLTLPVRLYFFRRIEYIKVLKQGPATRQVFKFETKAMQAVNKTVDYAVQGTSELT